MKLVLHNYWRSSASQRVRIGLALKGLAYEYISVNLATGMQLDPAYRDKNPMQQVPTLEVTEDDGTRRALTQSLPILEWLQDRVPAPAILPADPYLRARARALAELINAGIQPHQNLTTLKRIKELGGDDKHWPKAFIADGLAAYAKACADVAGAFSVGDAPSIADCCLIPQLASARRFGVDPTQFPTLLAIETRCAALPAFADAAPDRQPDAVQ
jgi:maleylpyruvate isomerase